MINHINKKLILSFIAVLLAAILCLTASAEESSDESIYDGKKDPLVTLSYVNEILKPQIIAEVLEQLGNGTTATSNYTDINIECGKMLKLSTGCELIYRGGGAVIITASDCKGDGITEIASGIEYFSGTSLAFGHIYYASESTSDKYILITGEKAYFTVCGDYYEID